MLPLHPLDCIAAQESQESKGFEARLEQQKPSERNFCSSIRAQRPTISRGGELSSRGGDLTTSLTPDPP